MVRFRNEAIRGKGTGDIVGRWYPTLSLLTDIMCRTRQNVTSFNEALEIMRNDWSWNV